MVKSGKAAGNDCGPGKQALDRSGEFSSELGQVMTANVSQFDMFQIAPDALVRIQVRCVSRAALQPDAFGCASAEKVLDGLTAMHGCAIPDDEQLALDGDQELLQKGDDGGAVVRLALHRQIEFARRRNGADDRIGVAVSLQRSTGAQVLTTPGSR